MVYGAHSGRRRVDVQHLAVLRIVLPRAVPVQILVSGHVVRQVLRRLVVGYLAIALGPLLRHGRGGGLDRAELRRVAVTRDLDDLASANGDGLAVRRLELRGAFAPQPRRILRRASLDIVVALLLYRDDAAGRDHLVRLPVVVGEGLDAIRPCSNSMRVR